MLDQSYLEWSVYGMPKYTKRKLLASRLWEMTRYHAEQCPEYASLLSAYGTNLKLSSSLENLPFFPVRLFKDFELRSISEQEVFKVLTSSGTTSQVVSKIFLDQMTAATQTKTLVKILQTFLGKKRLPMLIIDHPGVIKNRLTFSARGAGILGLANFGRDHTYALADETMALDLKVVRSFLERHSGEKIFIFGFTFMIWKYFTCELEKLGEKISIPSAMLIHSGGWKKLQEEAVDNKTFRTRLKNSTGISSVHDFYGMVEQVGSVYMECEEGYLHAPAFADVLIRDARTWNVCSVGQPGLVQVLSVLPMSYPGHSLLTEDIGVLHGEDSCSCGRLGKYFSIRGRVPRAELRGCSDTHATDAMHSNGGKI